MDPNHTQSRRRVGASKKTRVVNVGAADDTMLGECAAATIAEMGGPDKEIHPGWFLGLSSVAFSVTVSAAWWAKNKANAKAKEPGATPPGTNGNHAPKPNRFLPKVEVPDES